MRVAVAIVSSVRMTAPFELSSKDLDHMLY
jgi:hypothetical protein